MPHTDSGSLQHEVRIRVTQNCQWHMSLTRHLSVTLRHPTFPVAFCESFQPTDFWLLVKDMNAICVPIVTLPSKHNWSRRTGKQRGVIGEQRKDGWGWSGQWGQGEGSVGGARGGGGGLLEGRGGGGGGNDGGTGGGEREPRAYLQAGDLGPAHPCGLLHPHLP